MDISPGPPFWRIKLNDMDIPLLDHWAISGLPDADIHGAVNFAFTAFSEVRGDGVLRSWPSPGPTLMGVPGQDRLPAGIIRSPLASSEYSSDASFPAALLADRAVGDPPLEPAAEQ